MLLLELLIFECLILVFHCSILNGQCNSIADEYRFDCHPELFASEQKCSDRGCCWRSPSNPSAGNIPWCYFPPNYVGYQIKRNSTDGNNLNIELNRVRPSGFPNDIQVVRVEVNSLTDNVLRVKFVDANNKRFEPQFPILNVPKSQLKSPLYDVQLTNEGNLVVTRKSNRRQIFNANLRTLIFSNQFHQLSSSLPSRYISGLGEHKDHFRKNVNWKRYTFFNFDSPPTFDTPLYGTHPFYFAIEDGTPHASGVFLFNSNAMDIFLSPSPAASFRPIGGVLDFFIFVGENPSDVVADYIKLIGLPNMPPLWALGFHLSRYGYNNLGRMVEAWNRTRNAKIPLDVQWSDIDYMKDFNDFTYDKNNFAGLPQFINNLHKIGMHFVPILDPGVSGGEPPNTYPPFEDGIKMNIFIKHSNGKVLVGRVWNRSGKTVFADFTNPNITDYWVKQAQRLYSNIKFDGLWIDMNEISNMVDGSLDGCPFSSLENPQYLPGNLPLKRKSVCPSAQTYAGNYYDTHNLFSTYETLTAYKTLLKLRPGKRPFILSRSTFAGQGQYGNHWTGDVFSSWEDMRYSIPAMFDFNIFGIPLVGADICGFNGATTPELCARWMAMGAFYPFSRNHNANNAPDQDPAAPNLGPEVPKASRYALTLRYKLIPYLYTLFYRAHNFGETVVRPMFFTFPNDTNSYPVENQFMWGSSLLILPVLQQGATSVNAYLPRGVWYDDFKSSYHSNGQHFTLDSPIDKINVLIRGGEIIPFADDQVLQTKDLHNVNFNLFVALNEHYKAYGELYWDDGESIDSQTKGAYNLMQFLAENRKLQATVVKNGYRAQKYVSSIVVCGVDGEPNVVTLNSKPIQ
ncbi:lysosomal alpha-glucosidase-like protein, partial [Dinothrombium tinctorium]